MKIIITILMLWASYSSAIVCNASKTNKDPSVIAPCYAKLLSHFEELIKQEMAITYALILGHTRPKLESSDFRTSVFGPMLKELEQIHRMKHRLNYPDPRPAVRCEAPSEGNE